MQVASRDHPTAAIISASAECNYANIFYRFFV